MASVFLSYDREDSTTAARVAKALEKVGHSVWWDRRLKSGAQYSREIDEALKRSDAVVVLWSEKSVDSAWVRDEAASGRDSGKLVPARIGPVDPPLGFRQYQTTDLTRWKGRARSTEFEEMLEAIESLSRRTDDRAAATAPYFAPAPPAAGKSRGFSARMLGIAAVAAAALIAVGVLGWNLTGRSSSVPVVALAPADPSPESQALARDLFVKLGTLQTARADAVHVVNDEDAKRPDLILRVGRTAEGQSAEANLALIGGTDRGLLWATDVVAPNGNTADLRQQLAFTAEHVLQCAVEGLEPSAGKLSPESLKTYLNACAFEAARNGDPAALIPQLRELVRQKPRFAGGWAKLLLAEVAAIGDPRRPEAKAMRATLARDIAEARKLHPDLPEAYVAEIMLIPAAEFRRRSRLLDGAIARNPDSAALRNTRAMFLGYVGRMDDAVADASRAVELDPLSPATRDNYIAALLAAGRTNEARAELEEAERLWPGATSVADARFRLHLRYGDPRQALRLLHSGALEGSPAAWIRLNEALLQARIDRSPAKIKKAIQEARIAFSRKPNAIYGLSQTLVEFDREEELFEILLNWRRMDIADEVAGAIFRPGFSDFHKDARFMQVAKRLGLLDFWRTTGKWPDLCYRADLPYDCETEAAKLTT